MLHLGNASASHLSLGIPNCYACHPSRHQFVILDADSMPIVNTALSRINASAIREQREILMRDVVLRRKPSVRRIRAEEEQSVEKEVRRLNVSVQVDTLGIPMLNASMWTNAQVMLAERERSALTLQEAMTAGASQDLPEIPTLCVPEPTMNSAMILVDVSVDLSFSVLQDLPARVAGVEISVIEYLVALELLATQGNVSVLLDIQEIQKIKSTDVQFSDSVQMTLTARIPRFAFSSEGE